MGNFFVITNMVAIDFGLYEVLRKIPEVTESQAKEVAESILKIPASLDDSDLRSDVEKIKSDAADIKVAIAKLEAKLTLQTVSCTGLILTTINTLAIFR